MALYNVYYSVGGEEDCDTIMAHSEDDAICVYLNFLLEWGYSNNSINVGFAERVASIL